MKFGIKWAAGVLVLSNQIREHLEFSKKNPHLLPEI